MSVNTKVNGQLVKSAGLYSVSTPIGMADIYSTEEKEVGLWKNNKPLYQKTIVIGNGDVNVNTDSGNGTYRAVVDSGISNIDEGFAVVDKSFMILSSDSSPRYFTWIDYQGKGSSSFVVYTNASRTNVTVVLTIQYTKTTDTPRSGKFVPQGYGYVSSGDIYSEQERQIGVWTDGKPLYQKTVDFGALPNATTKAVSTGFESGAIDVVKMTGVAINPTSDVTLSIPRASSTTTDAIDLVVIQSNGYECVRLATASNYSAFTTSYITIQYTKTADVAGSGEYVPSGDKAVHYGTDEEVIGTYLGETLYRKVISLSTSLLVSYNSWTPTGITIANADKVISCKTISISKVFSMMIAYFDNNELKLQTPRNGTTEEINTIILEYTKTSS